MCNACHNMSTSTHSMFHFEHTNFILATKLDILCGEPSILCQGMVRIVCFRVNILCDFDLPDVHCDSSCLWHCSLTGSLTRRLPCQSQPDSECPPTESARGPGLPLQWIAKVGACLRLRVRSSSSCQWYYLCRT